MKVSIVLQISLVAFIITGCRCSGNGGLESAENKKNGEASEVGRTLQDQSSLQQGEQKAPLESEAKTEIDDEKPALPLDREENGKKKKVVKVVKKVDLPEYCKINIQADDGQKFSLSVLKIVRSCPKIRLTLQHTGDKPREVGGHNVVIVENSRIEDLLEKAIVAGSINHYVPRNDGRVVAATNLIGGKKSTQVEFLPQHFVSGVDYIFIDTFPDHASTMRGKVVFE